MTDTPFVETDVLLAVMEKDQSTARKLVDGMDPDDRRQFWRALVLTASMVELAGLENEPEPFPAKPLFPPRPPAHPAGSGLKRLGLFGEKR